ncbi:MAG: DUF1499 domain-containing protein [Silicimonas sp.]|nr:DUF1499 domain-containing protein [Silicimonas sp.]
METFLALLIILLLIALWWRFWPDDRDRWHVDPADDEEARRSEVRLIGLDAPRFPCDAETVLATMTEIAGREPRAKLLDGSIEEGMMTYVVRSRFGFRDYVTLKAVDEVGASKLSVWSRPRINGPDWGANASRMDHWLQQAEHALAG